MAAIDHWHPVLKSADLKRNPVTIVLCEQEIVLFRTAQGQAAALQAHCPHRRMPLGEGRVEGGCIVCPYHGWRFDGSGVGQSPANPGLKPQAQAYRVAEQYGAVWVSHGQSDTALPTIDIAGHDPIGILRHRISAPLELVLDNFTEVEHTPEVHLVLGYHRDRMDEVETRVSMTEKTVTVFNSGPQKYMPAPLRKLLRIGPDDTFIDEWVTGFSPVYTIYDHWWKSPEGTQRPYRLRTAVFFNPTQSGATELWSFLYAARSERSVPGLHRILGPIIRWLADEEIRRDRVII